MAVIFKYKSVQVFKITYPPKLKVLEENFSVCNSTKKIYRFEKLAEEIV